jgi:hypothetical protein
MDRVTAGDDDTVVYEVLSHSHRRFALLALRTCGGVLALADLSMAVARMEADDDGTPFSKDRARNVEVSLSLYHDHVPKMVDAGVVECDEDRRVVRLHDDLLA